MDEMKLTTKLMRGVVAKLISSIIKNKFGFDVKVDLAAFYITYDENTANIHLNASAQLDKDNLEYILMENGLM